MPKPQLYGLYGYSTVKALQDAVCERSIDRAWKILKEVFGPTEEYILRAIAEYEARRAKSVARRMKSKKRKTKARRRPRARR